LHITFQAATPPLVTPCGGHGAAQPTDASSAATWAWG
jgi:hypothetical protein